MDDPIRRSFETHWRMNPATRAVLDAAVDATVAAHGDTPFDVVLDVGCGRQSNVVFPGARWVVGTDIDLEGLHENTTVDVTVAGDIARLDLPESSVDAIACVYVLEHVAQPDLVFARLARALRPGGVMVIAVPNTAAPKAKVTRLTPLWFHRFFYERLLGRRDPNAGHPFATVLDASIRPDRVERLAVLCGLDVLTRIDFEDNKQRQLREKFGLTGRAWSAARTATRTVTGGRVDPELSDVCFAFHRAPTPTEGELAEALTGGPGQ